ncbi:hypothetical protein GQ600_5954 [Phytophthora cactorum]|nr:hypothetical protein GQ600_5954 [Phytophthora cactorum]
MSRVPAARTAPRAAPGDAQLAAAAEVVRLTYAADIEAAEARVLASRNVRATATSPTPAIEAPATQATVIQVPATQSAATRPAETDTAETQAVFSTCPPPPRLSSPHVQDSDVTSVSDDVASDDTMIPDNDVLESVYTPSDDEHGKLSDMLYIVLYLTVHPMVHIGTYCDAYWSEYCAVY